MKKFVAVALTFIIFCLSTGNAGAFYDPRTVAGNKAGVHILNPSEIEDAARLVNSNGGDWGYVTVPIQPTDRHKEVWQIFMHRAMELHLIPIIRITTIPQGGTWEKGNDIDLVDFANFLNELDWPVQNRYIVLFNEVNRDTEWGGTVNPEKYAQIVKNAYTIFKERSPDFFLLGPSLDSALPNSKSSLSSPNYLARMAKYDPLVWSYFDGWSSHSYPNPGFSASAKKTGLQSIVGYKNEIVLTKIAPKPVFITETGWDQTKLNDGTIASYWSSAWQTWKNDQNVVAVTPFVLRGGAQFAPLSLYKENGEYSASGQSIYNLPKTAGAPPTAERNTKPPVGTPAKTPNWTIPFFQSNPALGKLENIFRVIFGLPVKSFAKMNDQLLTVELSQTPKQWEKGLSGRTDLGELDGMIFVFPRYHVPIFWMKDMQFPIDIIWIAGNKVVDITPSAQVETSDKLPTYSPRVPIDKVLETRAGWAEENKVEVGATMEILK